MKSGPLIQKLRSVKVQVAERWEDETAFGDLYDVREVLAIVRSEAGDGSVTVDF
jgi:hypothetical protein